MSEAPLMLGVSGLRGIVGESLTPEVATRYAAAFGGWLRGGNVMVVRDGRAGGETIYEAVIEGLLRSGCDVYEADVQMTPTVGCVIQCGQFIEAGVVVTASHNPQEWNGIKLLVDGAAPAASVANEIIELFRSDGEIPSTQCGERKKYDGASELHRVEVSDQVHWWLGHQVDDPKRDRPLLGSAQPAWHVVVDSVNASGRVIVPEFFDKELNVELHHLFADDSGVFPHDPEPTAENLSGEGGLCDAVPGLRADVGFAQDPDGDRLAIVDENGRYIGEEYTLVLAAVSLLEALGSPVLRTGSFRTAASEDKGPSSESLATKEPVICVNLSTSRMIDDVAARYGARVVRTAVGEANVVEAMKKLKAEGENVILGGEGNGGVIWPKVTYVRDSLSAMALTLSLMARTGKSVSELVADVPSYAIIKRKQPLARKEDAAPTVERLAGHYRGQGPGVRVDTQDGVRVDFDASRAWVHVRASNTEPILRLIAEAPTRELAEAALDEVQRLVDK